MTATEFQIASAITLARGRGPYMVGGADAIRINRLKYRAPKPAFAAQSPCGGRPEKVVEAVVVSLTSRERRTCSRSSTSRFAITGSTELGHR
jgi:hypothetical protein